MAIGDAPQPNTKIDRKSPEIMKALSEAPIFKKQGGGRS